MLTLDSYLFRSKLVMKCNATHQIDNKMFAHVTALAWYSCSLREISDFVLFANLVLTPQLRLRTAAQLAHFKTTTGLDQGHWRMDLVRQTQMI